MLDRIKSLWPFVLKSTVQKINKMHDNTVFEIHKRVMQADADRKKVVESMIRRHAEDIRKATKDCVAMSHNRRPDTVDIAFQVVLDGRIFREIMNRTYSYSAEAEIEYLQSMLNAHLNSEVHDFMMDTFRTCRFK